MALLTGLQAKPLPSTMPFAIASQPGCPVQLSGELSTTLDRSQENRYTYKTAFSEINVSEKSIVLLVVKAHITEGRDFTHSDDFIYAADLFEPGRSQTFQSLVEPPGDTLPDDRAKGNGGNVPSAYVAFAQFSDGSTWGDSTVGKPLLVDRSQQWERLKAMEDVYRAQGEAKLLAEFEASPGQPASVLKAAYKKSNNDPAAVANKLFEMVKQGTIRQNAHARSR